MSWTDPCGKCGHHRADCDCDDGYHSIWSDEPRKTNVTISSEEKLESKIKHTFGGERMYSKSDVEKLCRLAFSAGEAYRTGSHEGFIQIHPNENDWIEKNLK